MIDLHSHTLHSDGQRTPDELLAEAAAAKVTVLSLTDHDTVSGIADASAAATRRGIRLVPGIELSCELHGREVHVLGHFLDPCSGALLQLAADMLAECGHARTVKDAFDRFLHSRGSLWVDRRRLSVAEAVALVRSAGGTSSIAHPGANEVSRQELKVCADGGLDAVEALHPDHVPTQAQAYERWAAELQLLVTAGSDYHGPAVQPGRKLGDRTLSAERFAALEERAT